MDREFTLVRTAHRRMKVNAPDLHTAIERAQDRTWGTEYDADITCPDIDPDTYYEDVDTYTDQLTQTLNKAEEYARDAGCRYYIMKDFRGIIRFGALERAEHKNVMFTVYPNGKIQRGFV